MNTDTTKFLRPGFTVTDLVAAIALCTIAIILLMPTLQQMREAARADKCLDRLRVLALGAQVFEAVNGQLPSELSAVGAVPVDEALGLFGPNAYIHNQHTSVLVQITPFIGRPDLLEGVDPIFTDFDRNILDDGAIFDISDLWFGTGFNPLLTDVVEVTCPSDNVNEFEAHAASINSPLYQTNIDTEDLHLTVIWQTLQGDGKFSGERTNYVACGGASTGGDNRGGELGPYRGAFGFREFRSLDALADGASNTVLFGENIGTIQYNVEGIYQRNFLKLWYMGGTVPGRGGVNWMQDPPYNTNTTGSGFFETYNAATPDYPNPAEDPDPSQGILGHARHARDFGFGSMHPRGVNFAFADGSVRLVGRTNDWLSLYAIFGAFDGDNGFDLPKPNDD